MSDQSLPMWLIEWMKPAEPTIKEVFLQRLRSETPAIKKAIIDYPPLAGARCRCCGELGVLARPWRVRGVEQELLLLGMALRPEDIQIPSKHHMGVAEDYEVIGFHAGITSDLLATLADTIGDA